MFSIGSRLFAQTYQPFPTTKATWNSERCWYLFAPGWHDNHTITMDGTDTLHMGLTYKKLFIIDHQKHGSFDSIYPQQFFGGIREVNKQIFIYQKWASVDTTEHLVYDFTNTTVGDTIYTTCLAGPSTVFIGHWITAVDSVLVGTNYHKRLHLQDPNNTFNTEYWIEGVGSSWGLPYATFWSITDNSYDLTCFYKSNQLQYSNPSPVFGFCTPPYPSTICDSLITSAPITDALSTVHIYPNPTNGLFTIEAKNATEYQVYTSIGQRVQFGKIDYSNSLINLTSLAKGIYYIRIKTNDNWTVKKILLK